LIRPPELEPAQALAETLPRLLLAAERLAFAAAPGLHGRRRAGPGNAFWQFRDWQTGDETRRIDWRRSAQGDRVFLREREWEAATVIELALDDTPGLAFRSAPNLPTKRDRAILLLLALAAILLRAGERVAVPGSQPIRNGPQALPRLAETLRSGAAVPPPGKARRIRFGDFLAETDFAAQAGGAVVQILDPAECDFPYTGRIRFEGFGGEPPIEAAGAQAWAEAYRARIAAHKDAVAAAASRAGQIPVFHRTDHPPATALGALYQALHRP
jgi:uncharacterized protein (DUF58 family)